MNVWPTLSSAPPHLAGACDRINPGLRQPVGMRVRSRAGSLIWRRSYHRNKVDPTPAADLRNAIKDPFEKYLVAMGLEGQRAE